MRNLTFICSLILIALGLVGYLAWEAVGASKQSPTALIPTGVGVFMLIGGIVALKNNMAGMHIAVLFSLLGTLAGLGRIVPTLIKGNLDFSEFSTKMVVTMTVICLFFTIMAVRSFIAARKARG